MRLQHIRIVVAIVVGVILGTPVFSQNVGEAKDVVTEELKQEIKTTAGTNVPDSVKPTDLIVPAPVVPALAPVTEEMVVVEPVKAPEEVKVAPGSPLIEELAPAQPPAKEATKLVEPEKKETSVLALDDILPPMSPAKETTPIVAPVEVTAPAPVAVPAVVPAEVATPVTAPDAGTKQALESAIKNVVITEDRIKLSKAVAQQEEVRRKLREIEGRKAVEQGDQAWKISEYQSAADFYKLALNRLPVVASCMALRNHAAQRLPECEYEIIRALVKEGKDNDAVLRGDEFLKARPSNMALKNLVTKVKARKPAIIDEGPAGSRLGGEKEAEVEKQMRLGKEAMAGRDYMESRRRFESALGLEPDNREAMRYLKVLGDREYNNKSVEREATTRKMTAEVRDTWNSKYKVIKGRPQNTSTVTTQSVSLVEDKMKKIVIDELEFRQANMHDVVDFLNKRSREMDKTTEDETKKGVNIILNLNPGGTAISSPTPAAKAADDPFGAGEASKAGGGGASGVPEVTFSAHFISLYNALKTITTVTGLKWRIDGDVVMIVPSDWDPSTIEMRMYPVEPTFIERVKAASVAMPSTTTFGGREGKTLTADSIGGDVPSDLKAYFENMGVKFPKGSSITYNSAIGKVIVANTADNLTTFEKILAELNVVPMQVEIEAKFVEVNETDLYEAGLEWLLTDNWELMMKQNANPYAPLTSNPRIQANANSADGGFTKGLRFYGSDSAGSGTAQAGGQGTLGRVASIAGILTNPDLTAILHALEQNGNADLLSAPKVTARSGEEAVIKVVTEYIYPTTFNVQGGQIGQNTGGTGNNNANIVQETTVVPQDFAMREVGVILNVLPEVSPDGNMISLKMNPQVVTDPIWFQYGSTVRRADGSEQILNMPQPFFQVRRVETKISIYDGATVVMGGLITESVNKVNDKIPVLGDIPFLGALFRSKSEKSIKKNLLIFVTAKLVDPAGHLIRSQEPEAKVSVPNALVPSSAGFMPPR
ncbi:MAG: hypothetical protein WCO42_03560 [bacterium]